MPSNLPTVEGYDPNRRTTLHLTDEALARIRTLEAQRNELLAALEECLPVLERSPIRPNGTEIQRHEAAQALHALASARATIRKAKRLT